MLAPPVQLATWLALNEPDIFVTLAKNVQAASAADRIGAHFAALGQDEDDFSDDSSADEADEEASIDTGDELDTSGDFLDTGVSAETPEQVFNLPEPTLEPISTDTIDTTPPPDVLDAASATPTSSGSTVGESLASGIGSAISSVGAALASPAGLKTLGAVASAYYGAQVAQSASETAAANAQTAQAVLGMQAAAAGAGAPLLPVTTAINSSTGLLEPVLAQSSATGTTYTPTTLPALASMLSSGSSSWLMWGALGLIVVTAAYALSRAK
jgi:hypothetical protein